MGLKVLVADPREFTRVGLRTVLENDEKISNIYEAESYEELKKIMLSFSPDLCIIHQALVRDIHYFSANKLILLISEPDIDVFLTAYHMKARGILSENAAVDLLKLSINSSNDVTFLDPVFFSWIMDFISEYLRMADEIKILSPREREIFGLLQDGQDRRSIAKKLQISESTLKTHIKNISIKKDKMKNKIY
jgi:DNA-binding NarL/FixJ family response regulator